MIGLMTAAIAETEKKYPGLDICLKRDLVSRTIIVNYTYNSTDEVGFVDSCTDISWEATESEINSLMSAISSKVDDAISKKKI